jgi:ferric-dicitrate binding protein FerR (iron transport regulator)
MKTKVIFGRWGVKGEAFFEMQKENRPFLAESGNPKINVLGTYFNII